MSTPIAKNSPPKITDAIVNAIRGFLIGLVELIPGVSGGTVALVVGVYERALEAVTDGIDAIKALFTDRASFPTKFKNLDWLLILPAGIAMVIAVFTLSGPLSTFITEHPEVARALFLGMVAVSIYVPLSMVDTTDLKAKPWVWVLFVLGAIAAFFATGQTAAPHPDPSLPVIFGAAMIAVLALMMPGLSGSFLLLALGLYAPIMASLSAREWDVIGTFVLGALLGVALFARLLRWLLNEHRTVTLITMAGLMTGSLRALWPWQDNDANLLAPESGGDIATMALWTLLGAVLVAGTLYAERRFPQLSGQTRTIEA